MPSKSNRARKAKKAVKSKKALKSKKNDTENETSGDEAPEDEAPGDADPENGTTGPNEVLELNGTTDDVESPEEASKEPPRLLQAVFPQNGMEYRPWPIVADKETDARFQKALRKYYKKKDHGSYDGYVDKALSRLFWVVIWAKERHIREGKDWWNVDLLQHVFKRPVSNKLWFWAPWAVHIGLPLVKHVMGTLEDARRLFIKISRRVHVNFLYRGWTATAIDKLIGQTASRTPDNFHWTPRKVY